MAQSQTYANLRTQEEDRIATAAARGFSLDFSDQQAEVDAKAAAIDAATSNANPADDLPRTQIPAEESVTGSPLPVDPLETADNNPSTGEYKPSPLAETTTDKDFISPVEKNPFGIRTGMMPPANLAPHPALTPRHSTPVSTPYNPNAKPILALRMPDGQHLIISGRTRHQIALADPSVKAVKTTLINYDPAIHTDDWVLMTNAGEHIISRTATTQDFRTYFTLNPITHAQAIEQGLVPIDPATSQPTASYIKGRQEAEHTLAAKAEADAAAAAEAKAKAEKSLPGQTKWSTPAKKAKPLSDSQTKQTLISVAGKTASTDGLRPVLSLVTIQRKKGTEYTVSTDARRLTVLSRSTTTHDTESDTEEFYDTKGVQYKRGDQPYPNWRQTIPLVSKHQASTTIDLSYYSFLTKGSVKGGYTKRIDSPFFRDGQHIFFNIGNHRAAINPVFMRDIYKQMQQLGKKLGFPPTLKAYYFDEKAPVLFTAEHNGITFQSIVMPQRVHALDENGNKISESGNYVYKTPELTPGDIILGQQPSIYGEQDTGSFSLKAKQEMQNVHDCVDELAAGADHGILHDTAWGKDIIVPRGRYGKKGFGVEHMHEKRLLHGFTEDEAAFIIVSALKAAESTENPTKRGNKWLFDKFGIRAVVTEQKEQGNLMITGFVLGTEGKEEAVDSAAAQLAQHFYALDELSRIQQVGAALQKALSRFEKIVNNNPQTWEQVVTAIVTELQKKQNAKANGENYSGSPLDAFSQQETSVSSHQTATFSLRHRPSLSHTTIMNARERLLHQVSRFITHETNRTARIIGTNTEARRAGIHFAQAKAINNAIQTFILDKELLPPQSPEYQHLKNLRHIVDTYVNIAQKGKLPARRKTMQYKLTINNLQNTTSTHPKSTKKKILFFYKKKLAQRSILMYTAPAPPPRRYKQRHGAVAQFG